MRRKYGHHMMWGWIFLLALAATLLTVSVGVGPECSATYALLWLHTDSKRSGVESALPHVHNAMQEACHDVCQSCTCTVSCQAVHWDKDLVKGNLS